MSSFTIALCVILPILALVVSVWASVRCMDKTRSGKKAFFRQLLVLAVALTVCFSCMGVAFAADDAAPAEEAAVTAQETESDGGIAQGLSFIGAVAEDPKSFGKAMIFVALGEAVAIYGFIIAFLMILPTLQ